MAPPPDRCPVPMLNADVNADVRPLSGFALPRGKTGYGFFRKALLPVGARLDREAETLS